MMFVPRIFRLLVMRISHHTKSLRDISMVLFFFYLLFFGPEAEKQQTGGKIRCVRKSLFTAKAHSNPAVARTVAVGVRPISSAARCLNRLIQPEICRE